MSDILEWFRHLKTVELILSYHWERIGELFIGEKIALASLLAVTVIEMVCASNRFLLLEFEKPKKSKAPKPDKGKKKKKFNLKYLALLVIALLPGGLVGSFVVYTIMGKEAWRRDALAILGFALVPGLLLLLLRASWFPWPEFQDAIYVSGLLGLTFALMQIWALIKLLREWWGEPDECVPWWPPLALWMQALVVWAISYRLLN